MLHPQQLPERQVQRELQEQRAVYDSRIKEHEGVLELLLLEKSKYVH